MRTRTIVITLLASALAFALFLGPESSLAQARAGYGINAPGLAAGRDYVAGQVIVGLHRWGKEGTPAPFAMPTGARVAGTIQGTAVLLEFPNEQAALKAIPALLADPNIRFVERNGFMGIPPMPAPPRKNGRTPEVTDLSKGLAGGPGARLVSGDPGTGHQWHLTVIRKTAGLGTLSTTPPTIAIIDTGVDYTHSDLAGKVIKGKNCVNDTNDPFDDEGHGTHVAGLAAAKAANGRYGEGVSHNSKIYAVKVLDSKGEGTFFQIACGMHDAHTKVTSPAIKVGNMSIAGPASALIATEVDHWKAAEKVLVVAAGNENNTGTGTFNIDLDIPLRVMATEENDCRAWFSNFSPASAAGRFDIAAPGWQIPSTLPDEGFGPDNGTSMASPIVAGGAALVWGQFPALTRIQLVNRLINNGRTISCGFAAATRRLDVRRAIFQTGESVVIGRVLDGASGKPPSPNTAAATVHVQSGSSILGTDATNRGGSYEVTGATMAGSSRNIHALKSGYVTDTLRSPFTVLNGVPTGPFTDAMSKARTAGYFHGTVDWKTTQPTSIAAGANTIGWDLDLGIRLPSGAVLSVGPAGDLTASPWVFLARDSFNDLEPVESFVIHPSAANGVYRIVVRRWTGPSALNLNASWAQVRLFTGSTPGLLRNAPACTAANPYWHVANVTKTGTSYAVTSVNTCLAAFP